MFKWHYTAAMVPVAILWGWILIRAEDAVAASWLLLGVPLLLWVALDWFASGEGVLSGPNRAPDTEERFFCYLFIGVGTLPFLSAYSGLIQLERFKPGFLPTIFGDGLEVGAFCLLGLIATSAVRLLAWSDSLFGRTHYGAPGGGGP